MNLDTLWVDMDSEILSLVWRGVAEIKSYDFRELSHVYLASESLNDSASLDEHQAQFEAIVYPPPVVPEEAGVEEIEAPEVEPEPETEASSEPVEDIDEAIEKSLEEAREAMRQAGHDPALVDEIMNGAGPDEFMGKIMNDLGLDPEQGAAALEAMQAQNAELMKEQGLSAEDIAMLFGGQE
jgi:hypothetical protein